MKRLDVKSYVSLSEYSVSVQFLACYGARACQQDVWFLCIWSDGYSSSCIRCHKRHYHHALHDS